MSSTMSSELDAVLTGSARVDEATRDRLAALGIAVMTAPTEPVIALVTDRGEDPARWRRDGETLMAPALAAAFGLSVPLALVVVPASIPPRPGPVAVVSPATAVSAYELHVAAALGLASGRRVEHLNGRGTAASAIHAGIPARAQARAAVSDWRERSELNPARALHRLATRPAVVILATADAATAAAVVADHPDADVVLVVDTAQARHGDSMARQVGSIVELALAAQPELAHQDASASTEHVAETASPRQVKAAQPVDGLPALRASDVVHVRMTDRAVELTNRTALRLRVRVGVGAAEDPDRVAAELAAALAPGQALSIDTAELPALAALAPPAPVMRHWSHEDAEVFEGGERRLRQLTLMVLDESDRERAERSYSIPNGLDFSVTTRDLGDLLQRAQAVPALPEPSSPVITAPQGDLWSGLLAALVVGRALLGGSGS